MKQKIIAEILQKMQQHLDNAEMLFLKETLDFSFANVDVVEIVSSSHIDDTEENQRELDLFIAAKRTEGCSDKLLKYYRTTISTMLETVGKGIKHISTDDLRSYLTGMNIKAESNQAR